MNQERQKKRLVVCCDGTWQKLTSPYPTNVVKIAQAIKPSSDDGTPQIVFYDEGVGAGNEAEKLLAKADRILGGAFGIGIDNNIQDAYRFLCMNYEPGDEIYLFGFSRGAYTVRSLAGLINCSGGLLFRKNIREAPDAYDIYRDVNLTIKEKERFRRVPKVLRPEHYSQSAEATYQQEEKRYKACKDEIYKIYTDRTFAKLEDIQADPAKEAEDLQRKDAKVQAVLQKYQLVERPDSASRQKVNITLLGCWDTVGELGVPEELPFLSEPINQKYKFHDYKLSSIIQNALHAMAIDEIRAVYKVTPMEQKASNLERQTLRQVWFPGAHGCIGGGCWEDSGLSNAALEWMMAQTEDLGLGLQFDRGAIEDGAYTDHSTVFNNDLEGIYKLTGKYWRPIIGLSEGVPAEFHDSVIQRWFDEKCKPRYQPENLKTYFGKHMGETENWKTRLEKLRQQLKS